MLIEQLELEGFLSYKNRQVIMLDEITCCLVTGKINDDMDLSNGSGKSSLFEMIPFNFFGKEAGRSDILDDYINWECDELFTSVIFKIDNRRWKSVRKKKRNASCTYEIFYDKNNKNLDNAVWKITDKLIENILGLSAKTYSSTIYLNERASLAFINGTSAERKAIFRELLDIDIYEEASKICSKSSKIYEEKIIINKRLIEDREQQIQIEDQIKNKLEECNRNLNDIKILKQNKENKLEEDNKNKKKIEEKIKQQQDKIIFIDNLKNEVKELVIKHNKLVDELDELEIEEKDQKKKYDDERAKIEEFSNRIENDLNNKIEEHNKIILSYDIIENKMTGIKKQIENKTQDLENQNKDLENIRNDTNNLMDKITVLEKEIIGISVEISNVDKLIKKIDEFGNICPITEQQCSIINDSYKNNYKTTKDTEITNLKNKQEEINKKLTKQLSKKEKFKENEKNTIGTINEHKNIINDLNILFDDLSKQMNKKISDINRLNELKNEYNILTERIQIFRSKDEQVEKYFKNVKNDKIELQKEIDKSDLKIIEKEKQLKEQEEQIELKDFDAMINEINNKIKEIENDIKIYNENISALDIENAINTDKLKEIAKIKDYIKKLKDHNKENRKYEEAFLQLVKYFGKDGIQKILMQNAIPMLEKYSNNLLYEFNDNSDKIKIKFDLDPKTQGGDRKKGGGLEILIAEGENNLRNLQNYSGGETVRIVFSIVFGLANLLSLRAGKKHEALIIDEKIAKLDKQGIEQFGKIINTISNEYKQIFVITHIEELKNILQKDEIIINKTSSGSEVEVIHG